LTQWAIKDLAVTDQLLEITGPSWDSGVGQAADRSREKRPIHVLDEVAEGCIGRRSPEPILQSHCVDAVIAEVKAPQIQQAFVAAQDPEHRNDQQGSVRDADAPFSSVLARRVMVVAATEISVAREFIVSAFCPALPA